MTNSLSVSITDPNLFTLFKLLIQINCACGAGLAQVIVNMVADSMNLTEAINAPRVYDLLDKQHPQHCIKYDRKPRLDCLKFLWRFFVLDGAAAAAESCCHFSVRNYSTKSKNL